MKTTPHQSRPARALGRFLTVGASAASLYVVLPTAQAQTWDGSDSGAWETAANWDTNAVPTTGVVFVGTTGSLPNFPVVSTGAQTAGELWLGAFNGNPSRLDVTGGSLTISTRFTIGPDATSNATLNQSGGTVAFTSAGNSFNIGTGNGVSSQGTYNLSAGTLSSVTWFNIGSSGTGAGTFNQSGGTVNAATGTGAVNIGDQGGATGILAVSGGAFNSINTTVNGGIVVGNHWTGSGTNNGTLTVSGTGLVNTGASTAGNGIKLASGAASVGTVNLDGGAIETAKVQKGAGTGTFNFNGGTLRATAANATYMTGLTNAFVKSGGAVIDTNSFDVTIGQALLTDAISIGGGLAKDGSGTLTLTGASTYTGTTAVNAGTLAIGTGGSLASAGLNIANGATFDTSALAAYDLGAANVSIALDAATAGFFNAGAGTLTLGGGLTLTFSTASLTAGTDYNLFDFGSHIGDFGSVSLGGSFGGSLVQAGDIWSGSSGAFTFSLNETNGVLSVGAIPEPSSVAALLGVAALGAVGLRRRHRR